MTATPHRYLLFMCAEDSGTTGADTFVAAFHTLDEVEIPASDAWPDPWCSDAQLFDVHQLRVVRSWWREGETWHQRPDPAPGTLGP